MTDHEDLREEMQYYENEHYNELRKLEAEEEAAPTLKADRDAWKARAEIAEAELKEAVEQMRAECNHCVHWECEIYDEPCHSCSNASKWDWRGARKEGTK